MSQQPDLEYRPRPTPKASLRAVDYVTAAVGAVVIFVCAGVLLGVLVAGLAFAPTSGPAALAVPVVVFVLALAAAASSYSGTFKRARRKRDRSAGR